MSERHSDRRRENKEMKVQKNYQKESFSVRKYCDVNFLFILKYNVKNNVGRTRAENSFVHVLTPESSDLPKLGKTTFNNIPTLMFQMITNSFLSLIFMKPDQVGNII